MNQITTVLCLPCLVKKPHHFQRRRFVCGATAAGRPYRSSRQMYCESSFQCVKCHHVKLNGLLYRMYIFLYFSQCAATESRHLSPSNCANQIVTTQHGHELVMHRTATTLPLIRKRIHHCRVEPRWRPCYTPLSRLLPPVPWLPPSRPQSILAPQYESSLRCLCAEETDREKSMLERTDGRTDGAFGRTQVIYTIEF
jgi:hypothetical protein